MERSGFNKILINKPISSVLFRIKKKARMEGKANSTRWQSCKNKTAKENKGKQTALTQINLKRAEEHVKSKYVTKA